MKFSLIKVLLLLDNLPCRRQVAEGLIYVFDKLRRVANELQRAFCHQYFFFFARAASLFFRRFTLGLS